MKYVINMSSEENKFDSQFIGDDETVEMILFHLNHFVDLPDDLIVTKRNSKYETWKIRLGSGHIQWEEMT